MNGKAESRNSESGNYHPGQHPASRRKAGVLCTRDRRCKTGCVGVSLVATQVRLAHGRVLRRFYTASGGGTHRQFRIDTLGATEAFRRAVAWRAAFERQVRFHQKPETRNQKLTCPN